MILVRLLVLRPKGVELYSECDCSLHKSKKVTWFCVGVNLWRKPDFFFRFLIFGPRHRTSQHYGNIFQNLVNLGWWQMLETVRDVGDKIETCSIRETDFMAEYLFIFYTVDVGCTGSRKWIWKNFTILIFISFGTWFHFDESTQPHKHQK